MSKASDLINQSQEELHALLLDIDKELFELRNKLSIERSIEKPHLFKAKKKERARILTVLTQMERQQQDGDQ